MIITKESKALLDILIGMESSREDGGVTFEQIMKDSGLDASTTRRLTTDLVEGRLADYIQNIVLAPGSPASRSKPIGITLTQRGFRYREIDHREKAERWKDRLVGFAFGVATPLLVELILWLIIGR